MHDAHILVDIHCRIKIQFDALKFAQIHNPSNSLFDQMNDK
jgi:hypothetical protein